MIKLKELYTFLDNLFPFASCQDFDNCGVLIGRQNKGIKRIYISLEITKEVVNDAIKKKVDVILTHHPVIFNGLKKITDEKILKLIENKISVISLHTNYDISPYGMNYYFAQKMKLKNYKFLTINNTLYYKFIVYTPENFTEKILESVSNLAGIIGNYSHCAYRTKGFGSFKPLDHSNPFIGKKGKVNIESEVKLEFVVPYYNLRKVEEIVKKVHPYEEVAYDVYEMKNPVAKGGFGIIFDYNKSFRELVTDLKKVFKTDGIYFYGKKAKFKKVCFSGGSANSLFKYLLNEDIDYFICGELKYDSILSVCEDLKGVFVLGHGVSEYLFVNHIYEILKRNFNNVLIYKAKLFNQEMV